MNKVIFSNSEQDLKDLNLTIEDIKEFTRKIDAEVIITDKCIIKNGKCEEIQ